MNYPDIQLKATALHSTNTPTTDEISQIQHVLNDYKKTLYSGSSLQTIGFVKTSELDTFSQDSVVKHWLDKSTAIEKPYLGKLVGMDFYQVDDLPNSVVIGLFPENVEFE